MKRALAVAGFALAHLLPVGSAKAQSVGFSLDRFEPSERGQDWFVSDSLDYRGTSRLAVGALLEWSHDPLVTYVDGERSGAIVSDQWISHVYASATFLERLRVSLDVPLLLALSGDAATVQGDRVDAKAGPAFGDLRVGFSARVVGEYASPFSLALGLQSHLPTGKQAAFFGDGSATLVPRALVAGQLDWFVYATQLALRVGPQRNGWLNDTTGQAIQFAASAGVRPIPALTIGPELWGSSEVGRSHFLSRTSTPLEVLLGSHYQPGDVSFGAGVGMGLGHGYGTPQVRAVLSVAWTPAPPAPPEPALPQPPPPHLPPPPPPPDNDGDGIVDANDACPTEAGVETLDPKTNGCPPPRDRDRDSVIDDTDACPDDPGMATNDPKTNGCPAPRDRDEDSIIDPEDACPDAPGPAAKDPEKNGCPLARIESAQIVILEAVRFANNSDVILPASEPLLLAVLRVIDTHPEIGALEVHGHTDDKGRENYNLQLSKRRAASVAKWLVKHGLAKSRITSFGFGKTRPLVPNDSDQNRQRNRRVEFHIIPKTD